MSNETPDGGSRSASCAGSLSNDGAEGQDIYCEGLDTCPTKLIVKTMWDSRVGLGISIRHAPQQRALNRLQRRTVGGSGNGTWHNRALWAFLAVMIAHWAELVL